MRTLWSKGGDSIFRGQRSFYKPAQATLRILPFIFCYIVVSSFSPLVSFAQEPTAQSPATVEEHSCLTSGCHAPLKDNKFVHAPVIQGDCQICHKSVNKPDAEGFIPHKFETEKPTLDLCGQCHRRLHADSKVVHPPFLEQCTACHSPHSGKVRYFLTAESQDDICLKCHKSVVENKKFLHAPVALNACNSCHAPHTSDYKGLLARPPETLCIFCHIEFKKGMDNAVSIHAPLKDACFNCHDPHGGNSRGFLPAEQVDLCKRCHQNVLDRMQNSKYPHTAMIENKKCSSCHEPHWSSSTKLLVAPSMDICLGCHTDEVKATDGRTLQAVGKIIEESKYLHGPIEQKDCTPCHSAHGSEDPRLFLKAFPLDFYAPYTEGAYELCFGCHNPELVESKTTEATGFRNGTLNMHYVHVHQEKGRSCRACHHEHASNTPFHLSDSVPFGNWIMKIEYEQTDTGGVCLSACHNPRSYDRVNPVENTIEKTGDQ